MHRVLLVFTLSLAASAQVFTFTREQMVKYTDKNPFGRFDDGRPKVPDNLLEKFKAMSVEEVWGVLRGGQYANQFEGGLQVLHPGQKLIGRAVTAQFMPARGDVQQVAEAEARARGGVGPANQRVIDTLQPGDVLVVDLFGKIEGGTIVGDNLALYVQTATKTGGIVVDGAIRDLEGIFPLGMQIYFRGVHPSAIASVMLTGVNVPVRIGGATVMPGDVVFGDRTGVYFIPPHLVQEIVDKADDVHIHDQWTQEKLRTGKYKSAEIYGSPRDPALKQEYEEYRKQRRAKK